MKRPSNIFVLASLMGMGLDCAYAAEKTNFSGNSEFRAGEIIVKFKNSKKMDKSRLSLYGIQSEKALNVSHGQFSLMKVNAQKSINMAINELRNDPNVEYAEPNFIYHAIGKKVRNSVQDYLRSLNAPSDPSFSKLWGLHNTGNNEPSSSRGNSSATGVAGADINALEAWKTTKGDSNLVIAVIDTGVDYNHPDLAENIWTNEAEKNGKPGVDDDGNGYVDDVYGYDFSYEDADPMDGNGHGTHCSGTIAASHDNGLGVAGVMAHAKIMAVKFLSDEGSGALSDAILAIDYATKMGAKIMSNSWGGGGRSEALKESIEAAAKAGAVFTAAAGNSSGNNDSYPHYPSNYEVENVVSVASHTYNNNLSSFSCYGKNTVHVIAPGQNILSTTPDNSYDVYSGTSMATPHVTGVIGLLLSHEGDVDFATLKKRLVESSVYSSSYRKKSHSQGRVDAANLLAGVVTPRPYEPAPSDWVDYPFEYESLHPYSSSTSEQKSVSVPGAKYVRVVVAEYDIESNYDALEVRDGQDVLVEKVDGKGTNYHSDYVEGDTLNLKFRSDSIVNKWGFSIKKIQYVP